MPDPRREVVTAAIETFWLEGMGDSDDLAEWWGTQDCHDTAAALADAVLAALDPVENPDE